MMNLSDQDSAASKMLGNDIEAPARGGETMDGQDKGLTKDQDWLDLAKQAHEQSNTFYETFLQHLWKGNLAHFHSEHAPNSKYHKVEYAKRSRVFRPKTRSMVLRKEAAAAGAFFSMDDKCGIRPVDPDNPRGQAAAAVMNAIVNHRLETDVSWFLIAQGNYQAALVQGICASKQYWDYEAIYQPATVVEPVPHPETGLPMMGPDGQPAMNTRTEMRHVGAKVDKPCIMPIPPENLRFHPNASWLDPVNTSPYLIFLFPMYALDVKKRATEKDPKTNRPRWRKVSDAQLSNAAREYANSIQLRSDQKNREQSTQTGGELKDFDTVWIHENLIKKDGQDYVYFTLGTEAMLTDPVPIESVYLHGVRPFVIGIGSIEAFNPFPQSKVQQLSQLQRLANEIANQRIDNVRLAMNGRYWVKDGKKVDLAVLQRSTPGSAVLMSDPATDVKWDRPADVTGSAYQEQDRINSDFDDLGGLFSTSTVQSDNHLNETVGGMKLMSGDASAVQEYELRIFSETYIQPVLRQIVLLEQAYETDTAMLALGGKLAQSIPKFGIDPTVDDLMSEQLLVSVSVGVGATSPDKRMEKLKDAFTTFQTMVAPLVQSYGPQVIQSPGVQAIAQEIFGAAGYKDFERFLDFGQPQPPQEQGQQAQQPQTQGPDPALAQQVMQVEQDEKSKDRAAKLAVARINDSGNTTRTIINAHKDLILKGIEQMAQGRGDVVMPSMMHNVVQFPQQQSLSA